MSINILMPALSPTMTEGNLVKWLKKEGDSVRAGDVIAEIETDKATMEVEAVDEGILGKIIIPEGTEQVSVNTIIALLLEEGEDKTVITKEAPPSIKSKPKSPEAPSPQIVVQPSSKAPPKPVMQPQHSASTSERIFASPLARRLAEHINIDLRTISGSGPHGRIVKHDIENASKSSPQIAEQHFPESTYTDVPLTTIRKIIAKRLTESKQDVPHFYLTVDCTIDALLALRADLNARIAADENDGQKLSVNDFIIRAVALTLIKVPDANVSWQESSLRQYHSADIAVAVAIKDGLITPIIRSAQKKTIRQLSAEMKILAEKARTGKLAPEEFQGGNFTISNLGMYGIKHFGAIINPPQACILAVGMGEQRPIVKDNELKIASLMTCTLSVDHRAVDGVVGSNFLAAFKEFIEDPLRLLI